MTDCTRFSDAELRGKEAWHVSNDKWKIIKDIQGKGSEACRGACISEPGCKVWKYNHSSGQCVISTYEVEDVAAMKDEYSSGRIRCAPEYDMLKIVSFSMIMAFIFVMWWYLTRPCRFAL